MNLTHPMDDTSGQKHASTHTSTLSFFSCFHNKFMDRWWWLFMLLLLSCYFCYCSYLTYLLLQFVWSMTTKNILDLTFWSDNGLITREMKNQFVACVYAGAVLYNDFTMTFGAEFFWSFTLIWHDWNWQRYISMSIIISCWCGCLSVFYTLIK